MMPTPQLRLMKCYININYPQSILQNLQPGSNSLGSSIPITSKNNERKKLKTFVDISSNFVQLKSKGNRVVVGLGFQ